MHDRGYELGFIGGRVRGLQHFTEMVVIHSPHQWNRLIPIGNVRI